ncbi:hypothetical protein [Paracoccus sp. (in: a-proteobacteria)]|uniref:hypothetical protein n=1 Tax=Paracoccus sp. TaxID=267 RepID=UPI0026DFE4C0|nr:hypothetical protein [Paracoccus sp. (in: a-proteobacteria)]MDO5648009.1 hypothetical protein [Paracoccus sp. (in: a-proteobacteria)]
MSDAAFRHNICFEMLECRASPVFLNASLEYDPGGLHVFNISPEYLDAGTYGEHKVRKRINRQGIITKAIRKASATRLPVYTNIGMTATHFSRQLAVAASANGEDPSLLSSRSIKAAAQEYTRKYADFYSSLVRMFPCVVAFYGPTRFEDHTKKAWLIYDDVMRRIMDELGVHLIDLREQLGQDGLLLAPEYNKEPDDDGVHANDSWGLFVANKIVEDIRRRESTVL